MNRFPKGFVAGAPLAAPSLAGGLMIAAGLLLAPILTPGADAQVAVRAGTLHTMAGPAISDGVVVVGADGRIQAVGPAASVQIPQGFRVMEAEVVTPGLVDAHSVVGLAGYLGQPHDQDQLERSNAIQPELRAFDAYNAREELVTWVRRLGTTTLHTGHGPGALMSGQTMVVKTRGDNVAQALVDSVTMVAMTLGPEVSQNFQGRPGSRSRGVAMVRAEFIRAQEYKARLERAESGQPPARDLKLETLVRVLDGEVHALITANRISEIMAALRLQEEFGFSLVLDGAAESYLLVDEIRAAGVPVILHPTMARHGGTLENATLETARILVEAGIPVSFQTGFEGYVPKTRVLLFEGAMAAAYGLPPEEALASMTIRPARLLGLDHRVGSLEVGKDGDLVLYSGDPLEHVTQVCGVIIEGEVVSEGCL